MKRSIKKVAVLGSGVMGSQIACHFANIGVQVLLLDIVPKELNDKEKASKLTLESTSVRNRIVNDALQAAVKMKPAPLYKNSFASRIKTGNFEDNMKDIAGCDWVIEVVVERLDIKKLIFDQVEKFRKPGTLITSNTSGIPINMMAKGRSEDFQQHFCGTHFFNPPRYLRLLEIIPGENTKQDVLDFLMDYGDLYLGKTTVLCKDTPAFIANRVGVYSISAIFHLTEKIGLTVEEVDKLTGPVIGGAKSATFRTADVVGMDTMVHVVKGIYDNCPKDEVRHTFTLPAYVNKMLENKWLGSKTKQGFYKKEGKDILALDLKTMEYVASKKASFSTLEATKSIEKVKDRFKVLLTGKDKAAEFYRSYFFGLFSYVSNRIPEISDELYKVDDAMRSGFGWEMGPFEIWNSLGNVAESVKAMEAAGFKPAAWVYDMVKSGVPNFYKVEEEKRKYYDVQSISYKVIPGTENFIILDNLRATKTVWKNSGSTLIDIGDGVLNLEFHTKMNTIGSEVLEGINHAISVAEKGYRGLVIGGDGPNFSAGANLGMIFALAVEQEYDELDFAIRHFQNTMMRVRYSAIPVVAAPHGLTLGGGCELCLHADLVQAHAETYIGLVEMGVGVIPAGGGTKEFALRASDTFHLEDTELPVLKEKFLNIGTAKVSTSAHEAFDLGIFVKGRDRITLNRSRLIADAKEAVIELADAGYTQAAKRRDIKVLGKAALGMFLAGADSMLAGGYITAHEKKVAEKLGYVLAGGDLSAATQVSEQYLLDLEREAFLKLCTERKTLERMQAVIKNGKPIRN
jgi:3-hydroxyacyl-CoA dehydrogenase